MSTVRDKTEFEDVTTDPNEMSVGFFDEQYINMARHNLASEHGASIIWGQRELQLREGMLSVFLKDDCAANVVFNDQQMQAQYLDLGSLRDTISVIGDRSVGPTSNEPPKLTAALSLQDAEARKYTLPVTRKSSVS